MHYAYAEDSLVEQTGIGFFAELDWAMLMRR